MEIAFPVGPDVRYSNIVRRSLPSGDICRNHVNSRRLPIFTEGDKGNNGVLGLKNE